MAVIAPHGGKDVVVVAITSRSRVLVGVLLLIAPVAGCAAPAGQVPAAAPTATATPSPPPTSPDTSACTEMGNAEGVNIHLTDVLDPAAGTLAAQVDLAELGVSSTQQTTAMVDPPHSFHVVSVAAELTGEPVTVSVLVRDPGGLEVYAGEGVAAPQLFQPNGARCDGENYLLSLVATTTGDLVPYPGKAAEPAGTAGARPFELHTHCGIDELVLDGAWYERVGGRLDDGSGNPPEGWDNPHQQGVVTVAGAIVTFQLREGVTDDKRICA